jgi:type IV secretion system protein VirB9
MPLVGFSYPEEDSKAAWGAYRQAVAFSGAAGGAGPSVNVANLDFGYSLSGDNPDWRPVRVYTDGAKTYIEFPPSIHHTAAPVLVALTGGGWFSSPTPQLVNYRMLGNRYIVDIVLNHAKLVSGVGGDQTKVEITRDGAR